MTDQAVRVERSGPVTTVLLHRPARRNAVDGPTAAELAALPQDCLRSDRASVLDAEGLDFGAALAAEFAHGREALGSSEAGAGAARFAAGAGRHGSSGTRQE
jgi:enoyl-CoA hydratase/carnithine racemase